MADLITEAFAKRRINQASFTVDETTLVNELIDGVGNAVERHCRREFDSQTYDEVYDGTGHDRLLLRQQPVISIGRVCSGAAAGLNVTNTSSSVQRATVAVTASGVTLLRVASGAETTNTLTFAGNVTLSALATAISGVGNGWSASAVSPYGLWASSELRATQGAYFAKNVTVGLEIWPDELADWQIDEMRGVLYRRGLAWDGSLDAAGWCGPVWFRGRRNYRVVYTAGYATVPEAVQDACATWVAMLYWQTKRDPGIAAAARTGVDSYSSIWSQAGQVLGDVAAMPLQVHQLLLPFRRATVGLPAGD